MTSPTPHVELIDIGKRFSGVQALQGITFSIEPGTVHALVGENGAGKSTLGRIIAGAHAPDAGTMKVSGEPVRYHSPRDALADGVTMIAQELTLVPLRSVIENVFLGNETGRLRNRRHPPDARALRRALRPGGLRPARRRPRRHAAHRGPAEGRDPPRAGARRKARRDGRTDGGTHLGRVGASARDRPRPAHRRHDDRVRLALPAGGAEHRRHGDRPSGRAPDPHEAGRVGDTGERRHGDARAARWR